MLTTLALAFGFSQWGNAQCDTLRNWNPNVAQPYQIISGTTGYVPGHETVGTDNILRWAEPYSVSSPSQVRGIRIGVHNMQNPSGDSELILRVWANNGGLPGAVLGSQVIDFDDINPGTLPNNFVFNVLEFTTPVAVNGDFFVGYELDYSNANDTIGIVNQMNFPGATNTLFTYDDTWEWDNAENVYGNIFNSVMDVLLSDAPVPEPDFIFNTSGNICLGGTWELDGSPSTNMTEWNWELWSLDAQGGLNQLVDSDQGSSTGSLTPPATGEYAIFLYSEQHCGFEADGVGPLEVMPAFNYTLTVNDEECDGADGSIVISNMSGGPGDFYYSWSTPFYLAQGTSADTSNLQAGTYNIQFGSGELDGNDIFLYTGCDVQETVTINNIPGEEITIVSGSTTTCAGDEVTLEASGNGTIAWTTTAGAPVGSGPSIQVTPTSTTSYIATLTDGTGCTDSEVVTVTVNTEDASFTFNDFCVGSSNNFPVNINTGGGTFSLVNPPAGVTIDPTSGAISNENVGDTYTVQYSITGDCPDTQTETVTITNADNASFAYVAPCDGNTIIASNIITPGGTFSLVSPPTGVTIDPASGEITGAQVGDALQVNYLTPAGACQNDETQTVEIFGLPNVSATADETVVCSGDEVTLTATGADSYDWAGVGAGAVQTVNPTATQNYIVTGTDANGCQNTDQVNVEVNPLPAVNAGSNITVCVGDEVTLEATAPTATTVSWDGGVVDGEAFTPSVGTTTYTVTVEDANGCENSDAVNVTVEEGPATDAGDDMVACIYHGSIALSGTPSGGTFSGPGVTNNEFNPADAGLGSHEITYVVESAAGCDGVGTLTIEVDECLAVDEFDGLDNVVLMPNPARDYVDIVVSPTVNIQSIEVIAVTGQAVSTTIAANGNTHRVDLSHVNTGAYFIRITSDEAQVTRKIIVK